MATIEKKDNMTEGAKCSGGMGCGMCSGGCDHGKMRLIARLRMLISLIILIIVFMCGYHLGSLTTMLRNGSARRMYPVAQGVYSNVSGGRTGGPMIPYGTEQGTSTISQPQGSGVTH